MEVDPTGNCRHELLKSCRAWLAEHYQPDSKFPPEEWVGSPADPEYMINRCIYEVIGGPECTPEKFREYDKLSEIAAIQEWTQEQHENAIPLEWLEESEIKPSQFDIEQKVALANSFTEMLKLSVDFIKALDANDRASLGSNESEYRVAFEAMKLLAKEFVIVDVDSTAWKDLSDIQHEQQFFAQAFRAVTYWLNNVKDGLLDTVGDLNTDLSLKDNEN